MRQLVPIGVGVGSLGFLSFGCDLVCCLLAILARRPCKSSSCISMVVGCVVIRVALSLYRGAFIAIVSGVLAYFSMNLKHLLGCILEKQLDSYCPT
jgi:hypothetical protein